VPGASGADGTPGAAGAPGSPTAGASYTRSPIVTGSGLSVTWTFAVPAGIAAVPSTATAIQGDTITVATRLQDAGGADLGDVSALATITSDIASDTITGDRVTFHHASVHTLTIAYGGFATTVAIQVTPLATGAPQLAATGLDALPWLIAGVGLLVLGAIALLVGRLVRRRPARD
jgi:hypothetical protein